jgi:hypothetical protein
MLRALEGEEINVQPELLELVRLVGRVRCLKPEPVRLDKDKKQEIWEKTLQLAAGEKGRDKPKKHGGRRIIGMAPGLAMIVAALMAFMLMPPPIERAAMGDGIATLEVDQGAVRILGSSLQEREAASGDIIRNGDCIIASAGTRASVEYDCGSIMRLEGEAEATLSIKDGRVDARVARGKSYHRVPRGEPYAVSGQGLRVTADGTAFTLEVEKDSETITSLESTLDVEVEAGSKTLLREGESFSYKKGGRESRLTQIAAKDIDNDWIRWNRDLDKRLGFPLGVLARVEEPAASREQVAQQGQVQPVMQNEKRPPAEHPFAAGNKQIQPEDSALSTPAIINLSAQSADGEVSFAWVLAGYSGFQGFKLFRWETNPMPAYADDWWKYIDGADTRAATDSDVQSGHTYYYRLGVYDRGFILGYSDPVTVTVQGQPREPAIMLTGSPTADGVVLSWSVSGTASYDGFKICKSEENSLPGYPDEWVAYVTRSTTYLDTNAKPASTCYYRIGLYRNGSIVKYSNAISVTLP